MSWIEAISVTHIQILTGAFILLQTVLIIVLLVQSRRRMRSQLNAVTHYAQMTHAARLASVGEITAAITHEVTQPLSAILSNVEAAELLMREPNPDLATVREILADVRQDDLRANEIVRRLRSLLRRRELQFERVDINALTSNVVSLVLPDAVRRKVIIQTVLDPSLPRVDADPVHIQQILLNLVINAMDAMQETPEGERWLDVRTEMRSDGYAQVAVLDKGHGISAAQKAMLFESFFTTKSEGMGLGLAIARSIVTIHGGSIWAENREGGGAVFIFTVPVKARRPTS